VVPKVGMDLSIIIVSYNTRNILRDCLLSVIKETHTITYEIIVVDNNSHDGSVAMLMQDFPHIKVIANTENAGFARANNQGIKLAKGKYILLLNSDTLVMENCLSKVFEFAQMTPQAGLIGCRVNNQDTSLQYSCWHQPSFFSELIFFTKTILKDFWDPWTYFKFMKYWDHQSIQQVDCLSGCFLWIHREVLDKIGLLDEDFFMYYEDFEFCFRVKQATDFKILYYPAASIIHLGQMSANPANFTFIKSCFQSVILYFRKTERCTQARIFPYCCRLIWRIEATILFILRFQGSCRRKYTLLKELINT
jgi:GT2 family glycosyltransferase